MEWISVCGYIKMFCLICNQKITNGPKELGVKHSYCIKLVMSWSC